LNFLPTSKNHTNNDGLLDIVIGNNFAENNQLLLNAGDGIFGDAVDLPGTAFATHSP
jgi:dTDP-glucose pyrophosphorylase